jgi:Holliday junction resolvase RusA-like endonuclease
MSMNKDDEVLVVLEGERCVSWNTYYAGAHWSARTRETNRVKMTVRAHLTGNETPFDCPVNIIVTAYFKDHPQDPDNIAAKLYLDALKGWLLYDDDRRYVTSVTTMSKVDKDNPRVEILVTPVEAAE